MHRYERIRQGIIVMEQEITSLGAVTKKNREREKSRNGRSRQIGSGSPNNKRTL